MKEVTQTMDVYWFQAYIMIGSAVIVLGTLVYIAKQTKLLTASTKSATYNTLIQSVAEFYKAMLLHPTVDERLFSEQELTSVPPDVRRAAQILFDLWANLYIQYYDFHTVNDTDWKRWQQWIRDLSKKPNVRKVWNEVGHWYERRLREFIEGGQQSTIIS